MRKEHSDYLTKYDSPMTHYLFEQLLNGNEGQASASDGEGDWAELYGKRILSGDNQGFVYLTKYDNADAALVQFTEYAELIESRREDWMAEELTDLEDWDGEAMTFPTLCRQASVDYMGLLKGETFTHCEECRHQASALDLLAEVANIYKGVAQ